MTIVIRKDHLIDKIYYPYNISMNWISFGSHIIYVCDKLWLAWRIIRNSNLGGRGDIKITVKWSFCFVAILLMFTHNRDVGAVFEPWYDTISVIKKKSMQFLVFPKNRKRSQFGYFLPYFLKYITIVTIKDHSVHWI